MTDLNQNSIPPQQQFYAENEIELMDLLLVLWKRKRLIILSTFACMVIAGIAAFMMPKVYEVSMIIEPGVIGMQGNGTLIFMDIADIKEKIENGVYDIRIIKKMDMDPFTTQLKFKAVNPKGSQFVKISSEWESTKIANGKKGLTLLYNEIAFDGQRGIQARRKDFDNQIEAKQNEIAAFETQKKDIDQQILLKMNEIQEKKNQIKFREAIFKNLGERKNELLHEIKQVGKNTDNLVQQKNRAVVEKSNGENISLLLYLTTVQQVTYFNQLNDQLNSVKANEDKTNAEIENLKNDINDNNTEIERLKIKKTEELQTKINNIRIETDRLGIQKSLIENFKILNEPQASISPIKPKKRVIVTLAGAVAFTLSIFLAFFVEYLQKFKQKEMIL